MYSMCKHAHTLLIYVQRYVRICAYVYLYESVKVFRTHRNLLSLADIVHKQHGAFGSHICTYIENAPQISPDLGSGCDLVWLSIGAHPVWNHAPIENMDGSLGFR